MQRFLMFLGFAQKAKKLASGEASVMAILNKGQAQLIILATDASERTKQKFSSLADEYGVAHRVCGTKDQLGLAIGRSPRSVLVIKDEQFAKQLLETPGVDSWQN